MFTYKVVLVGDYGTGKTSLIRRFVDNSFSEDYISTIGVSISKKVIYSNDKKSTIMIWDIEGKTDFKPIFSQYLNGSKAFIIVADLTRKKSIETINEHIEVCKKVMPDAPICIALNKSDLIKEDEDFDYLMQIDSNIVTVIKTSAKTSFGVEDLFEQLNETVTEGIAIC